MWSIVVHTKHKTHFICAKCARPQGLELFRSVECFSKTQKGKESETPHRGDFPLNGFEWVSPTHWFCS